MMQMKNLGSLAIAAQVIKPDESKSVKPAIKKFFENRHMSSIYTNGFEFAWVSKMAHQCMPFASCRDYLQGVAWSAYNDTARQTHSLAFNPTEFPKVDLGNIRIAVRYKDIENSTLKKYCKSSMFLLHEVEKEMGIPKTVLSYGGRFESSDTPKSVNNDTWVFRGDKSWMRSVYHMSMYSLLIRAGAKYKTGSWRKYLSNKDGSNFVSFKDNQRIPVTLPGIEAIVKDKDNELFAEVAKDNFPSDISQCPFDSEGIQRFSTNSISKLMKVNWRDKQFRIPKPDIEE
jgi:hypothetical protein